MGSFGEGQKSYEAVKITHMFTRTSGLTTIALNILNSHGCCLCVWHLTNVIVANILIAR